VEITILQSILNNKMSNTRQESEISSRDDNVTIERSLAEKTGHTQEPDADGLSEENKKSITGLKRLIVVGACTMATFLLMLDISIVATVRSSRLTDTQ